MTTVMTTTMLMICIHAGDNVEPTRSASSVVLKRNCVISTPALLPCGNHAVPELAALHFLMTSRKHTDVYGRSVYMSEVRASEIFRYC